MAAAECSMRLILQIRLRFTMSNLACGDPGSDRSGVRRRNDCPLFDLPRRQQVDYVRDALPPDAVRISRRRTDCPFRCEGDGDLGRGADLGARQMVFAEPGLVIAAVIAGLVARGRGRRPSANEMADDLLDSGRPNTFGAARRRPTISMPCCRATAAYRGRPWLPRRHRHAGWSQKHSWPHRWRGTTPVPQFRWAAPPA